MPRALPFSFSPVSPQHKEASTEERVLMVLFVSEHYTKYKFEIFCLILTLATSQS